MPVPCQRPTLQLQPCPVHRTAPGPVRAARPSLQRCRAGRGDTQGRQTSNPLLKSVWVGAEQFGNLVGLGKGKQEKAAAEQVANLPKLSRQEALNEIKADYGANYFVSGAGEMRAYLPDALFTDPFSGFKGVERFKKNVRNFSGLLEDVKLKITNFTEQPDYCRFEWRFSASIKLPWRPRIAAAGYTTHFFCHETGRIKKHQEDWYTEPSTVIKQLFSRGKEPQL